RLLRRAVAELSHFHRLRARWQAVERKVSPLTCDRRGRRALEPDTRAGHRLAGLVHDAAGKTRPSYIELRGSTSGVGSRCHDFRARHAEAAKSEGAALDPHFDLSRAH